MAPEVADLGWDKVDLRLTDAWACGIGLFAMLTGRFPFPDDFKAFFTAVRQPTVHFVDGCSAACADVVNRLLHVDPAERLSVAAALVHPWLSES